MTALSVVRAADSYRGSASEDRAEIIARDDGSLVLVVADGVGGRPGGGVAADRALAGAREFALKESAPDPDYWGRLLAHLDSVISEDPEAGETTCVLAHITEDGRIAGAAVGDSEAWLIAPGGVVVVLTESAARKPYLGYGAARPMSFQRRVPESGGTLLLATDGLFKYADPARIAKTALLPDPDQAAAALIDLARPSSGSLHDDIALLLCRFEARNRKPIALWRTIAQRPG